MGETEDEMVGWHHQLKGHKFEQTLRDGEGQGSLEFCGPWGCQELDTTQRLNNNKEDKPLGMLTKKKKGKIEITYIKKEKRPPLEPVKQ